MTLLSTDWFLLTRSNGLSKKIKGENLFNFDSINLNGYSVIVQKGTQSYRCPLNGLAGRYLSAGQPDDWYMLVNRGDKSYKAKVTNVLNDFDGLTPNKILVWWAGQNGYQMYAPFCEENRVMGDVYDFVYDIADRSVAAYMSIEPSSFDAVIDSGMFVAIKRTILPNTGGKNFLSVTRNGCTSNEELGSGKQAATIEVAYYDPNTGLYRRKNTKDKFFTFDPLA